MAAAQYFARSCVALSQLIRDPVKIHQLSRNFSTSRFVNGRMLFSQNHEYLNVTDSKAKVGITDHAQKELGDVVYVELPEVEQQTLESGAVACSVESVKAVAEVYMPIAGKIIGVNEKLTETPDLVNSSPYNEGWLVEVEITEPKQLESLMDEKAYESFLLSTD